MRKLPAIIACSLVLAISGVASADLPPPEQDKQTKKGEKKDEAKRGGCSIAGTGDAPLGLALLVLLISGVASRRRD